MPPSLILTQSTANKFAPPQRVQLIRPLARINRQFSVEQEKFTILSLRISAAKTQFQL